MKFLKFENQAAFEQAFQEYIFTDEEGNVFYPASVKDVAVDVVGIIPVSTGETREVTFSEGQKMTIPVMRDSEGYHVNLSSALEEFAAFEVPEPKTPYRVFAGYNSAPVPERVPVQVPRWAAVLALKSHPSALLEGMTLWDAVVAIRNEIIQKPEGESITMGGVTLAASVDLKNRVAAALDDANFWERASEMVVLIGAAIGLDAQHMDELFIWAGKQKM